MAATSDASAKADAFLRAIKPVAAQPLQRTVVLSIANGVLVVVQAWLIASIVDAVVMRGARLDIIATWLWLVPPVLVARAVIGYGADIAAFEAGSAAKRALRGRALDHIRRLGPLGLSGLPTGRTVSALTDSLQAIEPFFARYLPAVTLGAVVPLIVLAAVLPHDWMSAAVLVVTAPLIPVFMVLIGGGAERMNQRQWRGLARMSGHLLDTIQGLATLKIFNASRRESAQVARMAEQYRRDTMAVLRIAFLSALVLEFFATISIAMIAVLIGFRLLWGEMAFFNGFLVLLLAPELYLPLRAMGGAYHARMEAIGAAERLVELLDLPAPAIAPGPRRIEDGQAIGIAFEDVCVGYSGERRGLSGLTFSIEPGRRAALVGPSGGGKSSVLNLLCGFISPSSGRISIDGLPLGELDIAAWRRQIAYLPQRPHMFHATIAQNIAMSLDGAAVDPRRVRAAAAAAEADQYISTLSAGYDTVVGERGAGLSGGEVQRIAIARAFYRDAPLVLIDEATAHLDQATEAAVQRAIGRLAQGRTLLTVAHRLQTVAAADWIIVLDGGRLAEQGTPAALASANGLYSRLLAGVPVQPVQPVQRP